MNLTDLVETSHRIDDPALTFLDNAQRLRNVTLMVEQVQNDLRHVFLQFMPDCTSPCYKDHPRFDEGVRRYQALKG